MIPEVEPFATPGTSVPSGALVTPGGPQGVAGGQGAAGPPAAVSSDPGNVAILGTDSKIYVPQAFAGVVWDFAGGSVPTGWLLCNGAAVSRTTYAALYTALGGASSPWGQGDGSTTFNVPDLRGRVPIGAGTGSGLTARVLGATGGEEAHQLITAELAVHTHTQNSHTHTDSGHTHTQNAHSHTDSGHAHLFQGSAVINAANSAWASGTTPTLFQPPSGAGWISGTASASANISTNTATNQSAAASIQAATATNQNTGSGTAHNTMPPFAVLNKIIKT